MNCRNDFQAQRETRLVKKIYINGKFFCQRITGTQRYARELLDQIDKLLSGEYRDKFFIEVLVPRRAYPLPKYTNIRTRVVGRLSGTKWEQFELPWYCRGEILVTFSGGAPLLHSMNVIAIHDAAVFAAPAGYSRMYRVWYQSLYRILARSAKHILTVSNFSKSEIVKWCGAAPDKISVTYLGSEHFSLLEADFSTLPRFGISGKYIFSASSYNPNKNFWGVVQAVSLCDKLKSTQLVVAGGRDRRVYPEGVELPKEVRELGYVTDAELKALYQNAECFVFASLYEGFGLPPLEALTTGCPIVVSRRASLPEVFDGIASFCDPSDPDDIATAIQRSIESPPATTEQLKAFASKFSWKQSALEIIAVLESL